MHGAGLTARNIEHEGPSAPEARAATVALALDAERWMAPVAFDEALAERVRLALAAADDLYERKMFGGIAFMVSGHMAVGIVGDDLMVRLGPEGAATALARPHVRPMDFTGRVSRSMVFVDAEGVRADADLAGWVEEAAAFVATLPPRTR